MPQGGLEVSCKLTFSGKARLIIKGQKPLQEALDSGLLTSCTVDSDTQQKSPTKQPNKKYKIDHLGNSECWVQLNGIVLSQLDKIRCVMEDGLMINYAQSLQKNHIDGLKDTLLLHKKQEKMKQGKQIIHTRGNHWIVASNLRGSNCEVQPFDSLYTPVHKDTQKVILNLFESNGKVNLKMAEMSK